MQAVYAWFTRPPTYLDFRKTHKAGFLHVALLVTAIGTALISLLNFEQGATFLAEYLVLVMLLCLIGLELNHRHRYTLSASLLLLSLLIAIDFNLIDGAALHDPGVAAFPLLIFFGGFLFSFEGVVIALLASLVSIYGLYFGHQAGWLDLNSIPTVNRTFILAILAIASAAVTWAVVHTFERSVEYVRAAYEETIQGWARALELRDLETVGHSKRVTELAVALAQRLDLAQDQIEYLRQGALLHDIGKMGIPDSILLKPGALTTEEYEAVKEHPRYAYELLRDIPYFAPAIDVPHYHHEQWDGQGYPEGLRGDQIPLPARIFSVIDQWDALRSVRPYRGAWTDDDALKYLQENAGIRFDPRIVDAFISLLEPKPGNIA
jgi:putative nucleotidyltransferase with HDIG domain